MRFFKEPRIDFLSKRKIALVVSSVLILIGIISLLLRGGPNYGIDFRGGTSIELKFEKEVPVAQLRAALSNVGLGNSEIKSFSAAHEILIRTQEQGKQISDKILAALDKDIPDNKYEVLMVERVGPKIGGELRKAAILAILISLFFLLIYISWRFEFKFAVGAIVALFHDVLITLGVFSVLNLEISLAIVAAFLTIVGYSLNDTIVVFDRIRENLKILRRESYEKIINSSINQSLSRTIVTSLTTLLVVLILYFFGGEVIHNFAFALLCGVIVGTYSSIFVASPIVVEWQRRQEQRKNRGMARR